MTKTAYTERAKKFISQIYPYIKDFQCLTDIESMIEDFNKDKHRKVQMNYGSSRCVLITSDYVVKFDYEDNPYWGNCPEELKAWNLIQEEYPDKVQFFAPIELYLYEGMDFYIMPYIRGVGSSRTEYLLNNYDENSRQWLYSVVSDFHSLNFGNKNNTPVCIDYASFCF